MDTYGREPDGTCPIMQDERCGHALFNPPHENETCAWDFDPTRLFPSEDDAQAWHEINCPTLR